MFDFVIFFLYFLLEKVVFVSYFFYSENMTFYFISRHMLEIAGGLGPTAGKVWRIGLMGFASNEKNVLNCLGALDAVLSGMNAQINSGVAVRAAKQAYAN